MVRSFRAAAMRATILGLPAATRRSRNALMTGLWRIAAMVAMVRAVRTTARPSPILALPFHLPALPGEGRQAASAATWRRSRRPSSGHSASRVRAVTEPTPGTEASRSSASRQAGEPRTSVSMS
jgi:hypothetical protein